MTEPRTLAEHRRAKRIAKKLKTIDLDALEVAAPCPASWAEMKGDDRSRFCGQCEKNVFDFRRLTRDEIATLLAQAEDEPVCGRLYRRSDGTVMTADCPVGLAARLRRRVVRLGALAAAVVAVVVGFFGVKLKGEDGIGCPGFNDRDMVMGAMVIRGDEQEERRRLAEEARRAEEEAARRARAEQARREAELRRLEESSTVGPSPTQR